MSPDHEIKKEDLVNKLKNSKTKKRSPKSCIHLRYLLFSRWSRPHMTVWRTVKRCKCKLHCGFSFFFVCDTAPSVKSVLDQTFLCEISGDSETDERHSACRHRTGDVLSTRVEEERRSGQLQPAQVVWSVGGGEKKRREDLFLYGFTSADVMISPSLFLSRIPVTFESQTSNEF